MSSLVNLDELRAVLGKPFTPFVIELWAVLLFALGFAGWAMYTLDATGWEDEEGDDEPLEGMGEQGHALEGLTAEQKRQLKWMRKKPHILPGDVRRRQGHLALDDARHPHLHRRGQPL